jgi:anthranilate phosphoribosyltransferase
VVDIRRKLGVRTIFNLLVPMSNPANVTNHIIGVFDPAIARPMAETLRDLGSESAWITYGADGLDELSVTGPSQIVSLKDGSLKSFTFAPEDLGIQRCKFDDLRGGDADINAIALRAMLDGKKGPYRDIVVLNAAGALVVAGKADTLVDAIEMAETSIDSGAARHKLDSLIALTEED